MGLSFRKRKSNKKCAINIAMSESNGLSGSVSVKLAKNVTVNLGSVGGKKKRKPKTTINLGNGIKWTL